MAELAHDASGPASSDKGKLRVFISYSREDLDFADQLAAALDSSGFECFIDREGISGGEDWKRRLGNLISEADTVVFVLSPGSARSETCNWEVEEAARLNKRILPANWRPLEGVSPPPRLRELNYIFFYKEPKVPGSGFGTGLARLITALNTDFDWLREHTRYLQRAIEWDKGGRAANRLLSGNDIVDAKAWVARRPKGAPEPTAIQLDFIRASEGEAEARLSEQRKQLEAMAAAQAERETALHDREEAVKQRTRVARVRNIALVVMSISTVVAGLLGWQAKQTLIVVEQQKQAAEMQKQKAEQQRTIAEQLLQGATIIIARYTQMDDDTKKEAFTLFETGAKLDNAIAMYNLGIIYTNGHGVPQDDVKAREWFEKAAAKDHAGAMHVVGIFYERGRGGTQDYAKAREWFEKAAAKDHAGAMYDLGGFYQRGYDVPQDYAKARELFERAAAKDHANAMVRLGVLYNNGWGVTQDYAKAREWYEKAADKGAADAMANLGLLYDYGHGVEQDYAKAREWYEKAAAKDQAGAMAMLGLLYANGRGVEKDYAKAREWYEKAAAKDDADAKLALERLSIHEAESAGRYAEALQLQEALAAKVEAEERKRDGKPGEQTADELTQAAWYALCAKEFRKALTAADRAHALIPDDLVIETFRAHALMFMERGEEAKALYLAYKGKPLSVQDNRLWEHVIVKDFAELRQAGLTHPTMADVEKELGVSR